MSTPRTGSSVEGASRSQPAGANRGMHRPEPVAATWVRGEEQRLVQNTVSTNCGGYNSILIKHCVCATALLSNVV